MLGQGAFGKVIESEALGIVEDGIPTTVAVKMVKGKISQMIAVHLIFIIFYVKVHQP